MSQPSVVDIAIVCHEANRAYCRAVIGDASQTSWIDAPEWQRKSAIAGVEFALASDRTPEEMHISWLKQKTEEGWVFGLVKDPEKKTHPCCVPYAELPPEQKRKDLLFSAIVKALK